MSSCNPTICRLGQVESALKHISAGQQLDQVELQKVQAVERHLKRCADVRKIKDWASVMRESEAAIAAGADSSSLVAILNLISLQFSSEGEII